jgi:hypothetical protein
LVKDRETKKHDLLILRDLVLKPNLIYIVRVKKRVFEDVYVVKSESQEKARKTDLTT